MRIDELEYHSPETLEEACKLLDKFGQNVKVLGGGTDLLGDLKRGLLTVDHLVALARIERLKRIELTENKIWIGSGVSPTHIATSTLIGKLFPALSEAAISMAGMQVRNLATIGGNLCNAVPSADLPPSLLVGEALLLLTSSKGERRIPIHSFFLGPRKTQMAHHEILSGIVIPELPQGTGTAYEKYQLRDASALAVVGVAARLTLKGNKIQKALVAIGACAPTPVLIDSISDVLFGKEPSDHLFIEAGRLAGLGINPISDIRGSEQFRREIAAALTKRALKRAWERI